MAKYKPNDSDWEKVQNELLESLLLLHQYNDLVYIHLKEDNIVKAIESAKLVMNSLDAPFSNYFNHYQLAEVAEQAISRHIDEAIEIYTSIAERLIDEKSRESYNIACNYLLCKKENMIRNNQLEDWNRYINQVRIDKKQYRALIDELDKANVD